MDRGVLAGALNSLSSSMSMLILTSVHEQIPTHCMCSDRNAKRLACGLYPVCLVSFTTVTRPFESLGAAAAYSAVLVVFLQAAG